MSRGRDRLSYYVAISIVGDKACSSKLLAFWALKLGCHLVMMKIMTL